MKINKDFRPVFLITLLFFLLLFPGQSSKASEGNINIVFFGTEGCESCLEVKEFYLPQFLERYPQVAMHYFDLDNSDNYNLLLQLEKKYNRETNDTPVVVIGEQILSGKEEVQEQLGSYVEQYIGQGGCALPQVDTQKKEVAGETLSEEVYMAFFTKPGCRKCSRTLKDLHYLKDKYPLLHIKEFDVSQSENILIQEIITEEVGVPKNKALLAPMVVIGEDFLASKAITIGNLEALIQKYHTAGSSCLWANIQVNEKATSRIFQKIANRFKQLGPLAILGSGFLDGINPCAFATIIFLISWLAFIGKKGKDILFVGIAFTLAVFLTYFVLGLGMFQFLKKLSMLQSLRTSIFVVMAAGTLIFGFLSISDFFKVKKGKTREVSLQLPKLFKKRIHKVIKEKTNVKGAVAAAFSMGVIISLLELACTGQVYLPTIMVVAGIPELKVHAIFYLVLYNLAFILPLVVVFSVTYRGSSSKYLAELMSQHLATTKLLTGIFFFVMTLVLLAAIFLGV